MAILNNSNAISSGGYDINNSLRFRASASAYLNRTPASASNRTTWTWSGWVKRGALGIDGTFFDAASNDQFRWRSDDTFSFSFNNTLAIQTTQVFRDPSSWYHFVVVADTTQATAANRIKLYVNGVQVTAFSTASYPAQNTTGFINSANAHNIGRVNSGAYYFDGYMTEVNFIDGQALTPSSFGETDTTTGVWKPKAYTGTYGTNGFYLKFSDIATTSGSNAGLGKDFSGNTNYWTTNNISVTAGTTYDAMTDSPTLTSATVANYAVMNPLSSTSATLSNANLLVTLSASGGAAGTIAGFTSGKWYYEAVITGGATNTVWLGWLSDAYVKNDNAWSFSTQVALYGSLSGNNGNNASYGATYTTNDIIGVAIDLSTSSGSITFYKNGVSQGVMFSSLTTSAIWRPFFSGGTGGQSVAFNFGQRPFSYTPPTGFVRLNTYNLPDSTIKKGNTVMDAVLWTGAGQTSAASITGLNFKPDFVWAKMRSSAISHTLYNSIVGGGANKALSSNSTDSEASFNANATNGYLSSFDSNGFSYFGGSSPAYFSSNGNTYVGWAWQAGQGSTSSNTSGSITSTVSTNTTAGFSIVTYTGTGANATVGHSLGVAPKMVIVKARTQGTGYNWTVYHSSLGATQYISLNLTNAVATASTVWNNTAPTSTVFSLGNDPAINGNTLPYVAYCWAEISGFSKFGSYTGNGSADGTFVYLGFRPKYLMVKCSTQITEWYVYDSVRGTYNVYNSELYPNSSSAETAGGGGRPLDLLSNGFKIRNTNSGHNTNGQTYIYMAFAESPFKNANAR